jgi:hypothetical protein
MKKAKKVKEITSLSSATVDNIPVRELTEEEKRDPKNVPALAEHLKLEADAAAFASQFRSLNKKTEEAKNTLVSVLQTGREFIEANREFLKTVMKFFASNKARSVKRALNGHLTFESWSLELLKVTDDYVRHVFRATDKAFKFEDGTKLLSANPEKDQDEYREADEKNPPAQTFTSFANQLQMSTVKAIHESSYSDEEKLKITRILQRAFISYAEGLKVSLSATPEQASAVEEAAQAAGA